MQLTLPPQDYVLSIKNLVRLSLLYNGMANEYKNKGVEFARRDFPDWINDQLISVDGNIYDSEGNIVWNNLDDQDDHNGEGAHTMSVDRAFNDDPSYRWVSDFSGYGLNPPQHNHLHHIKWRMQLITAAFLISGRYQPQINGWTSPFI